ncbi:J domain-containing protein [Xanthomonas nasturtii]|uniref:J domain-containing protein n=1 Tax=Xanthomonas nasturtii TaxID=1843581 RepID=A0A3E1KH75_9XANT|nr:J domain-containing protein [Xanthomonas nasturtii]MCL1531766.1 J domain-containing protein [Xanthomonas nasturtii]MCL1553627.1 J domain-containing protein [Xanthomonas nasturtii]MCL1557704.1 J domain-containing protein [Xanthomonas nasturtii]MCL1559433.1 J domain-containing protein [Xanthomonas nasturtii]MCL1566454.1 J domain-containing protein [Xanthomonas nasturtii]
MPKKPVVSPSALPVSPALQQLSRQPGSAHTLSPARKRFDRLLRDLQQHRAQLHAWRDAVERWRARYHAEVLPLFEQQRALEIEQIQALDRVHASVKLSKTDRRRLSDEICELAGPLIETGHVELKDLYERHSEIGYDEEMAESDEMMKHVIGELYGLDSDEVAGVDSPEELFERVNARLEQAQAQAEHARAQTEQQHGASRRRSAKKAAAVSTELPPLRELYRKLASSLHPDRATDADDHSARTALMQRLNAAYKSNDLLGLLELQAEIGLLDAKGVDAINPVRLQEYNRELHRQCKELKDQLVQHAMEFCYTYDLDLPTQPKPERLDALLTRYKRDVARDLDDVRHERRMVDALRDAPAVKRWLKLQAAMTGMPGAPWF